MKLIVAAAAAAGTLCAASGASAACTVVSNHVMIVNNGLFEDGGLPFDLQGKAQWRVADSESGFLSIAKGGSLARDYPGNYPLMVDLQYSDKIRGWRDGPSVNVMDYVNARAQESCQGEDLQLRATTSIEMVSATTSGLDITVGVTFDRVQ